VVGQRRRSWGLWSAYQHLVVEKAVEQLHDQQATQPTYCGAARASRVLVRFVVARRKSALPLCSIARSAR
jgi:hypothetical protein